MAGVTEAAVDVPSRPRREPKVVVGVGASAGGLDALRRLLSGIDPDLDAAFVIAQHLSPTHASLLVDLLQREAKVPVLQVEDGVRLDAGVVYVCPPNRDVRYADGRLHLTDPPEGYGPKPSVDALFASLAEHHGPHTVAVVLSGTGSDGTAGLLDVRAAGGLTIAQDPVTAPYDGMPRSAIDSGAADLVLPAEAIADVVRQLVVLGEATAEPPAPRDLQEVVAVVERLSGVRLTQYKPSTVARRVERRMKLRQAPTFGAYLQLLEAEPAEAHELVKDVFITVTEFFRDLDAFEALRSALRATFAARPPHDVIRVWVAGCATGQEAYGIAMLCEDLRRELDAGVGYQVFATDISPRAIEVARRGVYGREVPEQVPPELLQRYFVGDADRFVVKPLIRDRILFSVHDLAKDPPFSRLQLVSCRNVLIYFNQTLQDRSLSAFHFALDPGGLLLLGRSESAQRQAQWFEPIDPKRQLYRKTLTGPATGAPAPYASPAFARTPRPLGGSRDADPLGRAVLQHLAAARVDAAVLVGAQNEVLYTVGRVAELTSLRPGSATLDLLELVDDDLRAPLRALVFKVRRGGGGAATMLHTRPPDDEGVRRGVRLSVAELPDVRAGALLVTLDRVELTPANDVPVPAHTATPEEDAVLRELESELASTRASLQMVVEELETTNEELQAANEELQSANEEMQATNEELQTTNEELQSSNEELRTLNDEMQAKNVELERLALDVRNIERGMAVPLLVLSRDLRVTRFSPDLEQLADVAVPTLLVGDPLAAVGWRGSAAKDLERAAREVVQDGRVRHVVDRVGARVWEARVAPYTSFGGERIGAMITFHDVTAREDGLQRVTRERALALATLAALGEAVFTTDDRGLVTFANEAAESLTGRPARGLVGRSFDEVVTLSADGGRTRLPNLAMDTLRARGALRSEVPVLAPGATGERRMVDYATHLLHGSQDAPEGAVVVLRDVTERERLVAEVERRGTYDALTDVRNRAAFERELEQAIEGVRSRSDRHALLFMDLDRFKIVNDTSGHAAGDQLLREVTRLFKRTVRAQDVIGRLGGDEFGVLVRHCSVEEGEDLAHRLAKRVAEYALAWGGRTYTVTLSVGLVPLRAETVDSVSEALANADIALYEAKSRGGNTVHVFRDGEAGRATRREFTVVNDLNAALREDRLLLYGQPIVDARDGRALAVEVLARLQGTGDRVVPPGEFLAAAERFGIVRRLDRAVVEKALALVTQLAAVDPRVRDLGVHVNVSGTTVSDLEFLAHVRRLAADTGTSIAALVFEVTESAMITDLAAVSTFVAGVRALGSRVALDDFGTGVSSFATLRSLAPEIVKVDGAFVHGCADDPVSRAVLRATVEVAGLGRMKVVAEHVEREEDVPVLRELGVDAFQGYLIGRPRPLEQVLGDAVRSS